MGCELRYDEDDDGLNVVNGAIHCRRPTCRRCVGLRKRTIVNVEPEQMRGFTLRPTRTVGGSDGFFNASKGRMSLWCLLSDDREGPRDAHEAAFSRDKGTPGAEWSIIISLWRTLPETGNYVINYRPAGISAGITYVRRRRSGERGHWVRDQVAIQTGITLPRSNPHFCSFGRVSY